MSTIVSHLDTAFRAAILTALGIDADPLLNVSQNEKFGDYQSNAAMGLAKRAPEAGNPRQIAEKIKSNLQLSEIASEISIAGPGFINVRLNPVWLASQVGAVVTSPRLGIDPIENPQTVVIDYSAPNVAKQMHIGHLRSTIIGDAISRIIEFQGQKVIRQNHIGDWGTQFGMLISLLKTHSGTATTRIEDLDQFYKQARQRFENDAAFADEARATVVRLQAGGGQELALWSKIVEQSRAHFQPIYDRLGIKLQPQDERGESFYNSMLAQNVSDLISVGLASRSEGAVVVFTEGSDTPIIIEKTGGGYGYATTDLAAIRYRVGTLGASRIVYFVGSPQAQHFKQVFTVAKKAGWAGNASLEHAPFGSVLGKDGKMFKARSGESVKLGEVLDEAEQRAFDLVTARNPEMPETQRHAIAHAVGIGAVKYSDLSRDRLGDYTFDWDAMLSFDGNTGPYLQYAYARIQSIFRRAVERGIEVHRPFAATVALQSPFELALAKHVLRFADVIDVVARELKPHHLCAYLYDLATRYSGFFENCPVLQSEEPMRSSRLTLCEAAGMTLACGLELLGIEHPDQM
jgi:arginyl-tRNA synthetase